MDSQEISLLNQMEELKQNEAREQRNRFKKLKEETKQLLKEPEREKQTKDESGHNLGRAKELAKRPKSAGRTTDRR